jgi:hypothetical protein
MHAAGMKKLLPLALLLCAAFSSLHAEVLRVWLTHRSEDPSRLCVNWQTDAPGETAVHFGDTPSLGKVERATAGGTLHHVEVPFGEGEGGGALHYAVESGGARTPVAAVKRYGGPELRAAVVADWAYAKRDHSLDALRKDDVHLLLTAGDNVPSLHEAGREGMKVFEALVDSQPKLFRTTPFMPILGNHDREIRPRGPKPPEEPVYDVEARTFREFFPLPEPGWVWRFDVPGFDVRFLALDLSHTQDQGTTWQTNHPFNEGSEQFAWYARESARRDRGIVITLQNERNVAMRRYEKGAWGRMFQQGSAVITGFGYFAERAEVDGFPYFNTALGAGAKYPDPQSKFFASEPSYVLLRIPHGDASFSVEMKNLAGTVLDRSEWKARKK